MLQHNAMTDQLTIFYGGNVNVFDDVPFDKVSPSIYLIWIDLARQVTSKLVAIQCLNFLFFAGTSNNVIVGKKNCRIKHQMLQKQDLNQHYQYLIILVQDKHWVKLYHLAHGFEARPRLL